MSPAQALRRRDHEGVGVELVDAISYPVFELICSVRTPHASLHAHTLTHAALLCSAGRSPPSTAAFGGPFKLDAAGWSRSSS